MRLRDLTTLDDYKRVVELEKTVWGYTDGEDVVPVPILVVTVKRGGILIGAFDDADEMAGFVYSLPGFKADARPMQWSHMLAVVDRYRSAGLGRQLKLAQRERALGMGLELIEWTYDPLQALNAHLNFTKLGVVVEEYAENIYGDSSSPLHRGTATDRFVAEWHIASQHVERRLASPAGTSAVPAEIPLAKRAAGAPTANTTRRSGRWSICHAIDLTLTEPRLWVEIPARFTQMQAGAPDIAREWRAATREIFTTYFRRGYRAVDFVLDRGNGDGQYLLALESPVD